MVVNNCTATSKRCLEARHVLARSWVAASHPVLAGMRISIDTKRMGAIWQAWPLLYSTVYLFICQIGLIRCVMMRAHRDRRPNAFKWDIINQAAKALILLGECSPYPKISKLGVGILLVNVTFGLYFLVDKIDKGAEQKECKMATNYLQELHFSRFLTSISMLRASHPIAPSQFQLRSCCSRKWTW